MSSDHSDDTELIQVHTAMLDDALDGLTVEQMHEVLARSARWASMAGALLESVASIDFSLRIWGWQREQRRPAWDEVFMMLAEIAATRSTCDRGPKQRFRNHRGTGACIASEDRRKVSLGYNGSVPGQPHCDEAGHEMVNNSCVRTIHAEENAILNATFTIEGSTIYTTTFPCYNCTKRIISVGVKKVVYQHEYKPQTPSARDLFAASLVEVRQLRLDPERED